jgi:hypothetical protein
MTCPAPMTRKKGAICGRKCIPGHDTCGMHTPQHRARGTAMQAVGIKIMRTRPKKKKRVTLDRRCLRCEHSMETSDDELCQDCSRRTLRLLSPVDLHYLVGPLVAIAAEGRLIGLGLAVAADKDEEKHTPGQMRTEDTLIISLSTWAAVRGIRQLPRPAPPPS